ncbi:hypothetical protein N7465_003209 [Penicillium sp. CMV-2018d]|nr:hypothetical protein N7465_003209 [Penicillium sp. CMV-2018d]
MTIGNTGGLTILYRPPRAEGQFPTLYWTVVPGGADLREDCARNQCDDVYGCRKRDQSGGQSHHRAQEIHAGKPTPGSITKGVEKRVAAIAKLLQAEADTGKTPTC